MHIIFELKSKLWPTIQLATNDNYLNLINTKE